MELLNHDQIEEKNYSGKFSRQEFSNIFIKRGGWTRMV